MTPEQLNAIKERMPKREDIVDWGAAQTMILEDIPALVAEVERLRAELTDIIAVATEEASSISHDNGYDDIITIARSALK
ncbi:hypothetical protein ACIQXW_23355 [Lysinibacillus sp. NPDC097162]|uniref:hypothetical protein n=1 Tax=Lysinibacillus sp. NPDC097162 TaxID=3364140 RepID=UPI0038272463